MIVFGSSDYCGRSDVFEEIQGVFRLSTVVGCSGGGIFCDEELMDHSLIVTVLRFEKTQFRCIWKSPDSDSSTESVGMAIARELDVAPLGSILLLSDGLSGNGECLLHGLQQEGIGDAVIWGGMAGGNSEFQRNWLFHGKRLSQSGVIAVGFYGEALEVRSLAGGGWTNVGPKRCVSVSRGRQVFAIDGRSVIDLYSEFLGKYSKELPAVGARYPLWVETDDEKRSGYLRSIIGVNYKTQCLNFAGDVPEGATVQMMRGDLVSLVNAARDTAAVVGNGCSSLDQGVVFACNCMGRRVVLGHHAELEIEAIRAKLPEAMPLIGFYSMGEFAQVDDTKRSEFFNETITLTTVVERNGTDY